MPSKLLLSVYLGYLDTCKFNIGVYTHVFMISVYMFIFQRRAQIGSTARVPKTTRRVIIGWKHKSKRDRMHKVIPPQKGGGKQEIDIEKHLSLKETTEYIANFYFHHGVNTASGLELKDLTSSLVIFGATP